MMPEPRKRVMHRLSRPVVAEAVSVVAAEVKRSTTMPSTPASAVPQHLTEYAQLISSLYTLMDSIRLGELRPLRMEVERDRVTREILVCLRLSDL